MESIFKPEENKKIIDRINKLTPDTTPLWGTMTVSQMLKHCQQPIKISNGSLKLKSGLMSFLFGRKIKDKMMSPKPFRKNLPTVRQFKITEQLDYKQEKEELVHLVQSFANEGADAIKIDKHPFFGKMNMDEWNTLHWKHLDHHLRQFNV